VFQGMADSGRTNISVLRCCDTRYHLLRDVSAAKLRKSKNLCDCLRHSSKYYVVLRDVPLQFLSDEAIEIIIQSLLYKAKPIDCDC